MQENHGQGADFASAKTEISDVLSKGKQSATEALHDARDTIKTKASEYAAEAKEAVAEKAEGAQQNISANMSAFGGAMRAASEHLANNDQRAASKFVLEAAGGIERLSSSLRDKPFEDVLEEIRSFGRQNSGALIAGSVLAGLALGRFIKSSTPTDPQSPDDAGADEAGHRGYSPGTSDSSPMEATDE
jgi:hypothetical protein